MIGLDTNVLVRHLTQDEPDQSRVATEFIRQATDSGEILFVSDIVLCELVWVLSRAYDYSKEVIAEVLTRISRVADFEFQDSDLLELAVMDYRSGQGDFADYFIGRRARSFGCRTTLTFDKSLEFHETFTLLTQSP